MVLTLANILQMPITVFTSVSNMLVLCIMPTTHSALTSQPIFLAYTQTGPGHYDCVVPIESSDSAKTKQKKKQDVPVEETPRTLELRVHLWDVDVSEKRKSVQFFVYAKDAVMNMEFDHCPLQQEDDKHMTIKDNHYEGSQLMISWWTQVNQVVMGA